MRKRSRLFVSILFSLIVVFISSCKDDEPAPKAKLSFAESTITVNEADDVIEIEIVLDKPVKEDITVEYSLKGTAEDVVSGGEDYEIISDYLEVDIDEGETTGIIEIQLYSDLSFEDSETIEIELENVDSDAVELTSNDDIEIVVEQEDGLGIVLQWPSQTVDMDLILRAGSNTTTWAGVLAVSYYGFPEEIFLPNVAEFAAYGLSYTYYDGNVDPLNFTVTFVEVINGVPEAVANRLAFNGVYTLANKNTWTDIASTKVVQTFVKSGGVFTNFSPLTIPGSGSRTESSSDASELGGTPGRPITLSNGAKIMLGHIGKK